MNADSFLAGARAMREVFARVHDRNADAWDERARDASHTGNYMASDYAKKCAAKYRGLAIKARATPLPKVTP